MAVRPGIHVRHSTLPVRRGRLVRGDVAGILGFILRDDWPAGARPGDYVRIDLARRQELRDHPLRPLLDAHAQDAVHAFFENGGRACALLGVCIGSMDDLVGPQGPDGVLGPVLEHLLTDDEIALLNCPAIAWLPSRVSPRTGRIEAGCEGVVEALLDHCRQVNHRFLVIDAPHGLHGDALVRWVRGFRERHGERRAFGALYYPWLCRGEETVAPGGAVLGMFARVEREHGPFGVAWPPANVPLFGITHAAVDLDWAEAGELAAEAINPILVQPGRGIIVLGARTLSTEPRWAFINARRIVSAIAEQVRRDCEWVVFEPNDRRLWKVIERDVQARLEEFASGGMLTGAAGDPEGYGVLCNEETNPRQLREEGTLSVRMWMTPISTTERITIDLRLAEGRFEIGGQ